VLRSDPQVIEALARRGITDPDLVLIDVWAYRDFLVPEKYKDRRVGWCDVRCRSVLGANPYARYVSGLGEAELEPEVVVLEVVVLPDRAAAALVGWPGRSLAVRTKSTPVG
jgi:Cu2+-containing amine oxidase